MRMKNRDRSILNCSSKGAAVGAPTDEQQLISPPSHHQTGIWGENLVVEWLQRQGWQILHQRWRCRWGELDIIALGPEPELDINTHTPSCPTLIFVEVKTRRRGNWDADGILAVSVAKQTKLWQAAQMFLSDRPDLANCSCRFDVALVRCEIAQVGNQPEPPLGAAIGGYCLILQDYIESAFSL